MSDESLKTQEDAIDKLERTRPERIALAGSLEGRIFPDFPGLDEQYAASLKAERDKFAEYFTITWDDLMLKFQAQGFRVFIGKNKEIHILPGGSADVENEGIMARHLRVIDGMDEDLVRLIQLNQK